MADYASLKVAELKKLLSEKGLSDKGNKPDLVARLKEHDEANGAKPAESKEDEITYSDDEASAAAGSTEKAPAPAADAAPDAAAPVDAKSDAPAADAAKTDDAPAAEEKPAVSYAMGLASTAADDEAKRRAERAKRFGIEEDEDAKRRAERAKRFGIDEKELASGLDSALPERSLKRGRGRTEGEGGGARPGKRQSLDRRGGRNRGERDDANAQSKPQSKPKSRGILEDPTEKAKAEARAARFAGA
ncbi:hypothetical protein NLU13_1569 [Sarocladium strictum]|uniref:SAP domain-containing protein n=1 Tax=Sarocladium strictum TaxID=5046 RepID=A0AA39LBX4_SARSR|nr:hypothetical protein NLU13_1569 [Sarocladium strictum]